jgi:formiminoglutamase
MNGPLQRPAWLTVERRDAPLLLSFPHTGLDVPDDCAAELVSLPLARHDADWFIDRLYGFAAGLCATTVHTALSRTVIDVNRDPSGASLYPGQATTGLVPTETFDGRPLYREGGAPSPQEIERRKELYFQPYHAALEAEIMRLRARHPRIVLYDCHSIRSRIPRLFGGELPVFNIGTNSGRSCDPGLEAEVARICAAGRWSCVVNGRFTGGWITRSFGRPAHGIHALQMELALRGYLADETDPVRWDEAFAASMQETLRAVLDACLAFARTPPVGVVR